MNIIREKLGFICDMDGVIYHGNTLLPGVKEFVDWLYKENKKFLFLTNNSCYTPRELQQKLARMGLDVSEDHFYTSALATAAFLKEQAPGCSVYAIGEAALFNALYDAGITMNDINPDLQYRAAKEDPYRMKKKTVRGGSWKDPVKYIQGATRSYEYQNESRSYIGFRCVRSYAGNDTRR